MVVNSKVIRHWGVDFHHPTQDQGAYRGGGSDVRMELWKVTKHHGLRWKHCYTPVFTSITGWQIHDFDSYQERNGEWFSMAMLVYRGYHQKSWKNTIVHLILCFLQGHFFHWKAKWSTWLSKSVFVEIERLGFLRGQGFWKVILIWVDG